MAATDLAWCSATELLALYRSRAASPLEATQAVLRRIESHDGQVNAFAHFAPDAALATARRAEAAIMRGEVMLPLLGIPTTIKDLVLTRTMPTQNGSLTTRGARPEEDAPAAERSA